MSADSPVLQTQSPCPVRATESLPTATIIIVNYNGGLGLQTCLRTLVDDLRPGDDIILVDNASQDGSADAAEQAFPEVKVVRSAINLGFAGGNNLGARYASTDYLAFINPDTCATRDWLSALIAALEADPTAGMATSKILLMQDPAHINTCGNEVHCTGLTLCRGAGTDGDRLSELAEVAAVSGAAFAMRRDLFEQLGGLDETFFLYMEDTDLSWRVRLYGYRCLYVPNSVIYHDYSLRFGEKKTYYQERNRYLLLLKALRWRSLLALLPALLLAEVVTWGFVLSRERKHLTNKATAYVWIAKNWRVIMAKRRATQMLRHELDRKLIASSGYQLAYDQTGTGLAAKLAQVVFDPAFRVLRGIALSVVWW